MTHCFDIRMKSRAGAKILWGSGKRSRLGDFGDDANAGLENTGNEGFANRFSAW